MFYPLHFKLLVERTCASDAGWPAYRESYEWNTFWTRGVCPGCSVQWPITECLSCAQYSAHEAWYHYREPTESVEEVGEVEKHSA